MTIPTSINMEAMTTQMSKIVKFWARTVGMPIGETDHDRPRMPPITQKEVKQALILRTFWICLHVVTCAFIIASSGKNLGLWL